jgi:hypothetical protein
VECPTHNDCALNGVLEKCVLERWLKRAGIGVADSKARTDFELSRAMDFDIDLAALRECKAP